MPKFQADVNLKKFGDAKINATPISVLGMVQNTVGKGENAYACNQHFPLFPPMYPERFFRPSH